MNVKQQTSCSGPSVAVVTQVPQRKLLWATGLLLFDFELFIGARCQERKELAALPPTASSHLSANQNVRCHGMTGRSFSGC